MLNSYYTRKLLTVKAHYHSESAEILTNWIFNTTDPDIKKRLWARRSHHRRLARKYIAMAERCETTEG